MGKVQPEWIAVAFADDGVEAWAMSGGTVQAHVGSTQGTQTAASIEELLSGWEVLADTPVVLSGAEIAPADDIRTTHRKVPCPPLPDRFDTAPCGRFRAALIPGLWQEQPAAVLLGGETKIAGFLSLNQNWDGVICLPGNRTHWVQVSAGEVVSFESYLTGALFKSLAQRSGQRDSTPEMADDLAPFDDAVADAIGKPEKLAARLASIEAGLAQNIFSTFEGMSRFAGSLIGAEIAAARPYWLGMNLAVIGSGPLAPLYARALGSQGAPATVADAGRMTLSGLTAAYRRMQE